MDTCSRILSKNTNFQAAINESRVAKSRVTFAITLRREKRSKIFKKKRMLKSSSTDTIPTLSSEPSYDWASSRSVLISLYNGLVQGPYHLRGQAISELKRCMLESQRFPLGIFAELGFIPLLINLLRDEDYSMKEAASLILCDMASGQSSIIKNMLDNGIVRSSIREIRESHFSITDNLVCCLGNIALESDFYRQQLLKEGVLEEILSVIERDCELELFLITTCIWALFSLSKAHNSIVVCTKTRMLSTLSPVLMLKDAKLTKYTLGIFSYISDGSNSGKMFLDAGLAPFLLKKLASVKNKICLFALQTISNIVLEDREMILLQNGLMDTLYELTENASEQIRKELYYCLSNLASEEHLTRAIVNKQDGLCRTYCAIYDVSPGVCLEASWLFRNLTQFSWACSVLLDTYFSSHLSIALRSTKDNQDLIENLLQITSKLCEHNEQAVYSECAEDLGNLLQLCNAKNFDFLMALLNSIERK